MGFSDEELKDFFSGSAYFGWFWMGNLDGMGRSAAIKLDEKAIMSASGKYCQRERELGMKTRITGIYRPRTAGI